MGGKPPKGLAIPTSETTGTFTLVGDSDLLTEGESLGYVNVFFSDILARRLRKSEASVNERSRDSGLGSVREGLRAEGLQRGKLST